MAGPGLDSERAERGLRIPEGPGIPAVPWSDRRLASAGVSPFLAGAALGLLLVGAFLAVELAVGHLGRLLAADAPAHLGEDFRIAIVLMLVAAYVPAATVALARAARRTAAALAPVRRAEAASLAAGAGRYPPGSLRRAGVAGIAAYLVLQAVADRDLADSFFSLLFVDSAAAPGLVLSLGGAVLAMVGLASVCLALPIVGVRRAIAAAKTHELAWCNREIRRRRDALERRDGGEGAGLADLVAYKDHVAGVREWLLDAPTLARFGLYLALPLGSWLGGAVVERLVDAVLG